MHTWLVLQQNGKKRGKYVFLLLWEHEIYMPEVCELLLYAAFSVWKQRECSVQKAGSMVAYCKSCFQEEMTTKFNLLESEGNDQEADFPNQASG